MNKLYKNLFVTVGILASVGILSCNSDIDKVYVNTDSELKIYGASDDVILSADFPTGLALTIYWEGNSQLSTSNDDIQAPLNVAELTLQLSESQNFDNVVEISIPKGEASYQFLTDELNALLTRLNYSSETLSPLYIRIRSELASNLSPIYSNVLSVNVQPYRLSLTTGKVLASDQSETDMRLGSPEENGVYTGFMGVAAWYNWWFLEANNTLWGNNGDTGVPFEASTADSHWNFWFPEDSGCYYVTLNTNEGWWSALHIDELSIDGEIFGAFEYNQKANVWTMNIDKPAGTYNLLIKGKGVLYDVTTDTYREGSIPKEISFAQNGSNLEFKDEADGTPIQLTLPGGATTIVLDLNNPLEFTLSTGEVPETPSAYDEVLWMSGFDDGITGEWNFNCYLTAYNQDEGKYAAVNQGDSLWGWQLYTDNNWGGAMGTDSTDPYSGNLIEGGGNIPSPTAGKYLIDVSLSDMTYSLSEVTDVWYTGLNDDWNIYPMTLVEGCVYEAEVEKYAETPWGVKILLRDDWSMWFGGADGILRYGWDGFNGDNDLPAGTYILTVDLANSTYSYKAKE